MCSIIIIIISHLHNIMAVHDVFSFPPTRQSISVDFNYILVLAIYNLYNIRIYSICTCTCIWAAFSSYNS